MISLKNIANNTVDLLPQIADMALRNPKVALELLPSAFEGYILEEGKNHDDLEVRNDCPVHYNWKYDDRSGDTETFKKIYSGGKTGQWNSDDRAWTTDVDPLNLEKAVFPEKLLPMYGTDFYPKDEKARAEIMHSTMSWMLSQFLHGEQGALHISCQTVEVHPSLSSKLYGATQVMDEARHVEVFYRYLNEKLERLYVADDNLFTILRFLSSSPEWDQKYLGMQIMIEGLALGAFSLIYKFTKEPLLKELLKGVIADEARHVHYGVAALKNYYRNEISDAQRREREDWAYEVAVMLRNRFLFKEIYDEYFAHKISFNKWKEVILDSPIMEEFRKQLFSRMMPNIREIGLLSDRMRERYEAIGVLRYADNKSADQLTLKDMLADDVEIKVPA